MSNGNSIKIRRGSPITSLGHHYRALRGNDAPDGLEGMWLANIPEEVFETMVGSFEQDQISTYVQEDSPLCGKLRTLVYGHIPLSNREGHLGFMHKVDRVFVNFAPVPQGMNQTLLDKICCLPEGYEPEHPGPLAVFNKYPEISGPEIPTVPPSSFLEKMFKQHKIYKFYVSIPFSVKKDADNKSLSQSNVFDLSLGTTGNIVIGQKGKLMGEFLWEEAMHCNSVDDVAKIAIDVLTAKGILEEGGKVAKSAGAETKAQMLSLPSDFMDKILIDGKSVAVGGDSAVLWLKPLSIGVYEITDSFGKEVAQIPFNTLAGAKSYASLSVAVLAYLTGEGLTKPPYTESPMEEEEGVWSLPHNHDPLVIKETDQSVPISVKLSPMGYYSVSFAETEMPICTINFSAIGVCKDEHEFKAKILGYMKEHSVMPEPAYTEHTEGSILMDALYGGEVVAIKASVGSRQMRVRLNGEGDFLVTGKDGVLIATIPFDFIGECDTAKEFEAEIVGYLKAHDMLVKPYAVVLEAEVEPLVIDVPGIGEMVLRLQSGGKVYSLLEPYGGAVITQIPSDAIGPLDDVKVVAKNVAMYLETEKMMADSLSGSEVKEEVVAEGLKFEADQAKVLAEQLIKDGHDHKHLVHPAKKGTIKAATVLLHKSLTISGVLHESGEVVSVPESAAIILVENGEATFQAGPMVEHESKITGIKYPVATNLLEAQSYILEQDGKEIYKLSADSVNAISPVAQNTKAQLEKKLFQVGGQVVYLDIDIGNGVYTDEAAGIIRAFLLGKKNLLVEALELLSKKKGLSLTKTDVVKLISSGQVSKVLAKMETEGLQDYPAQDHSMMYEPIVGGDQPHLNKVYGAVMQDDPMGGLMLSVGEEGQSDAVYTLSAVKIKAITALDSNGVKRLAKKLSYVNSLMQDAEAKHEAGAWDDISMGRIMNFLVGKRVDIMKALDKKGPVGSKIISDSVKGLSASIKELSASLGNTALSIDDLNAVQKKMLLGQVAVEEGLAMAPELVALDSGDFTVNPGGKEGPMPSKVYADGKLIFTKGATAKGPSAIVGASPEVMFSSETMAQINVTGAETVFELGMKSIVISCLLKSVVAELKSGKLSDKAAKLVEKFLKAKHMTVIEAKKNCPSEIDDEQEPDTYEGMMVMFRAVMIKEINNGVTWQMDVIGQGTKSIPVAALKTAVLVGDPAPATIWTVPAKIARQLGIVSFVPRMEPPPD